MELKKLIFLFLGLPGSKCENLSTLVLQLQLYFNLRSTIIFRPINQGNTQDITLLKELTKFGKSTTTYHDENRFKSHPIFKSLVVYEELTENSTKNVFDFMNYLRKPSSFTWLVLAKSNDTKKYANIFIPFDCQFILANYDEKLWKLTEIYKTERNSNIIVVDFGTWSFLKGLNVPEYGLYKRRNQFYGAKILTKPQFDYTDSNMARNPEFFGKNWEAIAENLNLTSIYVGETDPFDINTQIHPYYGASSSTHLMPFMPFSADLFYREPEDELLAWDKYLKPFSGKIWLGLMASTAISAIFMAVALIILGPQYHLQWSHLLYDGFYILLQRGSQIVSPYLSVRIITFTQLLGSLILFSAYSATFISFIAVVTSNAPFTTLEGVLAYGKYNVVMLKDKGYPVLKANRNPTLQTLLKKHVVPENELSESYLQNFKKVCFSDKKFLTELAKPAIYRLKSQLGECRIAKKSVPFLRVQTSWICAPNSHFKDILRLWSWRLRESGALSVGIFWKRDYLRKTFDEQEVPPPNPIRLMQIVPILTVFVVGAIIAFVFLFIEGAVFFRNRNRKK